MYHAFFDMVLNAHSSPLVEATHKAVVKHMTCQSNHTYQFEESVPMNCRFANTQPALAVCEEGGGLALFRTGEERARELLAPHKRWAAHRDAVFDVSWSPTDHVLLSGAGDYFCCTWDPERATLLDTCAGHHGSVKSVRFQNRNQHVFASAGRDGHIMIWDMRVSNNRNDFNALVKLPVAVIENAHSSPSSRADLNSVTSVLFSLDDAVLTSSGADGNIKFWDTRATRRAVHAMEVKLPGVTRRPHGITSLALSPSGSRLAACSLDNHIYEYDYCNPTTEGCRVYAATVSSFYVKAVYSLSGYHIASGSSSIYVNIYDTTQPMDEHLTPLEPVHRLEGHTSSVSAVDWSRSENELSSCCDDGIVCLWTVQMNKPPLKRRRAVVAEEQQENMQVQQQQQAQELQQQQQQQQQQLVVHEPSQSVASAMARGGVDDDPQIPPPPPRLQQRTIFSYFKPLD